MTDERDFSLAGGCTCRTVRYRLTAHAVEQLPAGMPAVAEYYDRNVLWPKESLERRRALLEKMAAALRWKSTTETALLREYATLSLLRIRLSHYRRQQALRH